MDWLPPALVPIAAALACGLLVGMERGWRQRDHAAGSRVAGIRTFGLIGLAGGLLGALPTAIAAVGAFGIIAVLVVGYARIATSARASATTTIAAMLTLGLGVGAVRIGPAVALAGAATAMVLLSARRSMHSLLKGMTEAEIDGVAQFAVIALVVLPLLPDAQYGPYGAWNPRGIWMVVVFVTALGLAGYVALRRFGSERGLLVVAISGAIVSSTAVTAALARRMRQEPASRAALTAGIALASLVMFVRVQLLTLILVPRALPTLAIAMAPATLLTVVAALAIWWRRDQEATAPVELGNPFELLPALILAGSVAILSVVARWAIEQFDDRGIGVVMALTGMLDVDAAVLTMAGLPAGTLNDDLAGIVLALPVIANTFVKAWIAALLGGGRAGLVASLPLFGACVISVVALLLR